MWNVKLLPGFFRGHSGCDLIDTLWNVKLIIITQRVETVDLIDTLWNVKGERDIMDVRKELDLIDTLWNVKFVAVLSVCFPLFDLIDTLWNVKML